MKTHKEVTIYRLNDKEKVLKIERNPTILMYRGITKKNNGEVKNNGLNTNILIDAPEELKSLLVDLIEPILKNHLNK